MDLKTISILVTTQLRNNKVTLQKPSLNTQNNQSGMGNFMFCCLSLDLHVPEMDWAGNRKCIQLGVHLYILNK